MALVARALIAGALAASNFEAGSHAVLSIGTWLARDRVRAPAHILVLAAAVRPSVGQIFAAPAAETNQAIDCTAGGAVPISFRRLPKRDQLKRANLHMNRFLKH